MKYRNLIYCKHSANDRRAYLYELPMDEDVQKDARLCVEDKRGEHIVTAFCANWVCTDGMTKTLCEANGGYYPPARVVGTVDTITIRQDVVNKFREEMPF